MDGMRLEDVISGNREGSLAKDEVVAYVQSGDPTNQAWDDWPLRMTFCINSFLRANGPMPEADLAMLGFLDDQNYFKNTFFRHTLPLTTSHAVDPPFVIWPLLHQNCHADSTLHLFLGTHLLFRTHTVAIDTFKRLRLICLGCDFF